MKICLVSEPHRPLTDVSQSTQSGAGRSRFADLLEPGGRDPADEGPRVDPPADPPRSLAGEVVPEDQTFHAGPFTRPS